MTAVPAKPFFMHKVTVKIGDDTFEEALSTIRLVPTTPRATFKGLGGNVHKFIGTPAWVCNATFAQDLKSAASLHKTIGRAEPGTPLDLELTAQDGGDTVKVTILTEPTDIGGDIDTVPTASVPLEVDGQPEFIAPTP